MIEALQQQHIKDVEYANSLSAVLNIDCGLYNNSLLSTAIINLLRCWFPIKEDHCEIEFYCYWQNFGRVEIENEVIVETPEEFYERLVLQYSKVAELVDAKSSARWVIIRTPSERLVRCQLLSRNDHYYIQVRILSLPLK
ncbi:MAG TPA: hypothetical protein VKX40_08250, partial [Aequorivita sp.]|nr:hypothetical protein [Aequorivita sp.]